MTRADALKKLRKVLGPKMTWSENERAARGPEERAAAADALPEARQRRDELKAKRDERYRAILAADGEYQALLAEHAAARAEVESLQGQAGRYRCRVGVIEHGILNLIKAQGDNWAEVVSQVVK